MTADPDGSHPDQPWSQAMVRARAESLFRTRFSGLAALTAAAPGRVNLIGEHTDYSGGFVLPIAIDRVCIAAISPSADPARSRITSDHATEIIEVDLRQHIEPQDITASGHPLAPGAWQSYAIGVLAMLTRHAADRSGTITNIDLALASSVPPGGGLSSSAAVEMAVATAAAALWSLDISAGEKANLCRRAEHEFAGVPCGIMDQFIAAHGQHDHALLIDCRSQQCEQVPMPPAKDATVIVFNSGVRHALASGQYAQRRAACAEAARILNIPELRDASLDMLNASTNLHARPDLLPIARHVVTENARTCRAAQTLRAGDLATLGALMNQSHDSLRDDYRVSCPELDTLVDLARASPGVHGARMTGGGFGGCIVAICQPAQVADIIPRIQRGYLDRHGNQAPAFATQAGDGARVLETR